MGRLIFARENSKFRTEQRSQRPGLFLEASEMQFQMQAPENKGKSNRLNNP
jgi:hypothetical protein